jgi:hypothetical protein
VRARIFAEQYRKWWTLAAVAFAIATVRKVAHAEAPALAEAA